MLVTESGALPDKHRKRWGISESFVPGREETFYPLILALIIPHPKKGQEKETGEKTDFFFSLECSTEC